MTEAPHILIVEARFYADIADELLRGARAVLDQAGVSHESVAVPGAFEIPVAVRIALRGGKRQFDGFVALGCVIRGETSHYDYVCGESARKLQDMACEYTLALGYGILTCENRDQAWARARVTERNKGGAAARACLEMIEVKRSFHLFPG